MTRERVTGLAVALGIGVVAAAAYAPTTGFPFVRYDDDIRLLSNEAVRSGLSAEGVAWAFTSAWDATWSPVTWISHMLDFSLYASDAGGHHAMNVLLHAANAVLLFLLLRAATGASLRSAAVALVFAVHPVHVETVAWVSERKGLLAATFGFAALWVHAAGARRGELGALALLLFALGLMAKPMLVSLPLLALLLDRLGPEPDAAEESGRSTLAAQALALWPWFLLAGASALVTLAAVTEGGAARSVEEVGIGARLANALVTSVLYLGKLLWPANLAPFYPHPGLPGGTPWSGLEVAGALAVWLALAGVAWRSGHRALRAGLAWYALALLPVSGLVQVGSQAMADRYLYLPAVGIYLATVWVAADLLRGRGRVLSAAAAAAACVALAALGVVGQRQIQVWHSSESLFRHAVEVTEGNFSMHFNLANGLKRRGRIDEAIEHYRAAVAIHPGMLRAHYNLANTLAGEDRSAEAIEHYRAALAAAPDFEPARRAIGRLLIQQGDLPAALAHYREVVEQQPDSRAAQITLGHLQRMAGDLEGAARAYEAAAELSADGEPLRREARALRAQHAESHASD